MDADYLRLLFSIFGFLFTLVIMAVYDYKIYRMRFKFIGHIRKYFSALFMITFFLSILVSSFFLIVIVENTFGIEYWNLYLEGWYVPLSIILVFLSFLYGIRLLNETNRIAEEYAFPKKKEEFSLKKGIEVKE